MRRKAILSLTMIGLILGTVSVAQSRDAATTPVASLRAITTASGAAAPQLLLRIVGPYSFQPVRATGDSLLLDLKGVRNGGVAKDGELQGGVFGGYHLLQYSDANGAPVARLQLSLKQPASIKIDKEESGLRLTAGADSKASSPSAVAEPVHSAPAKTPTRTVASQPVPDGPVAVSGITIKSAPTGETYVDIATSRAGAYNVLHLSSPERLVLDFEGARTATAQRSFNGNSPWVKSVRVGQFREKPAVARVVADLVGNPSFDVHAQPGGVRVEIRSRSAAKSAAAPLPSAPSVPVLKSPDKPVEVAKSVAPPVAVESIEKPAAPVEKPAEAQEAPKPVALAIPSHTAVDIQSLLPTSGNSPAAAASPKPEAPGESPEAVQAARAALTMGTAGAVYSSPQGLPAGQEQPKYTGEPISLNLKDVDLKDFFRLIHEISGLNIIVDPNVTGNVTLVLDAVPWDQALDIVLKNNRLGKTLEGNVLRIARVETITAEQEATLKLAQAREDAQPLVTVFRPVNYAKATNISTMLKSWVGGGALSKRGNILVDDRTNTLIVSDIQTQIPVIESIISRLDKKAKQVSIEARIVRANSDFSRSLGVALAASYNNRTGTTVMGAASGANTNTGIVGGTSPGTVKASDISGFGVYAISNAGTRYMINAAIAAAETKSQAKTISRPSIVTQNNVPGTVQQGSQIPIQTTINNTISIQYVNASLTLRVTPQVTEDGNIFLDIQVTNAQPGAVLTSAGPSINTQQATTQVLVPDGGTVVFGGVTVASRTKSATYVPVLGSIPVLGHLFKTSNVQDSDQELLFFVSPKVLPG
ncbi:MAG: type IV pilus secretin PilQ [Terriglobia bacterium]